MDSATRPKLAYRSILLGLLVGLDNDDDPDVQECLYGFLDDLAQANPLDVALGAFELVTRLAADLGTWNGQSRTEILRELAASVATDPIP
jgi:hypothetical protein